MNYFCQRQAPLNHRKVAEKGSNPLQFMLCCVVLCAFSPPFCALCECGLYSPPKIPCYIIHASSSLDDSLSTVFPPPFFSVFKCQPLREGRNFSAVFAEGFWETADRMGFPPWHLGFSVGNFRDPCKNGNPLMVSFEYYSHKNPLKIWITLLVRSGMNDEGVFFCEKSGRFLLGKNVSFFAGLHYFWMAGLWMVR